MPVDWKFLADIFKFAPGVIALLIVIYLLYKLLLKKEETMIRMIEISESDVKRQAKLITLLEILVNRKQT